jgi:hypothetical protein
MPSTSSLARRCARPCRLLRARRQRPRGYRAAEQRDELAASHDSSPKSQDHAKGGRKDTTGVTALQGINMQSTGWTMTASGRTRDWPLKKTVEAATVSGLLA